MAEPLKSKAPLPLTMYKIESEVFSARTREHGTQHLVGKVLQCALGIEHAKSKAERDMFAIELAATCVRTIEEVK